MVRNLSRIPLLIVAIAFAFPVLSQPAEVKFTLATEEDGVKVYVRSESNGDYSVRVVTVAGAGVQKVYRTLNAAEKYPEWVHRCSQARNLAGGSQDHFTYVSGIDMPFPFRDREVVGEVRQHFTADGSLVRTITATPDAIPPTKGLERLQVYEAEWRVTPLAQEDYVSIQCTVRTDAGSGLPNWLRKEIMTGGPVKTIVNLRKRLESK